MPALFPGIKKEGPKPLFLAYEDAAYFCTTNSRVTLLPEPEF